jgi:hypothetical protein
MFVTMDNSAFWNNPTELADLLRNVAEKVEDSEDTQGALMDSNGNTVGHWSLDEDS